MLESQAIPFKNMVSSVEKGGIICGKSLPDQVQQQKPIGTMVSIVMKVSKQAVRQ